MERRNHLGDYCQFLGYSIREFPFYLFCSIFLRDHLVKMINEQEALNKNLKDRQKSAASTQVDGKKQTRLWKDLLRQMELKRRLANVIINSGYFFDLNRLIIFIS